MAEKKKRNLGEVIVMRNENTQTDKEDYKLDAWFWAGGPFENIKVAEKYIKLSCEDGRYMIVRSVSKHNRTTETVKKVMMEEVG